MPHEKLLTRRNIFDADRPIAVDELHDAINKNEGITMRQRSFYLD